MYHEWPLQTSQGLVELLYQVMTVDVRLNRMTIAC